MNHFPSDTKKTPTSTFLAGSLPIGKIVSGTHSALSSMVKRREQPAMVPLSAAVSGAQPSIKPVLRKGKNIWHTLKIYKQIGKY